MAQASKKRTPAEPLGNQLSRNVKEVSMIALGALSIYLLIALASYHPDDPGWSRTGSVEAINNNAGVVGAWIADVLLYLLGYIGYLFPLILAYVGWRLFRSRKDSEPLDYMRYSIRAAGFIFLIIGVVDFPESILRPVHHY